MELKKFKYSDENGDFDLMELRNRNILFNDKNRPNLCYPFYINPNDIDDNGLLTISLEPKEAYIEVFPLKSQGVQTVWRWGKEKALKYLNTEIKGKKKQDGGFMIVQKYRSIFKRQRSVWDEKEFVNERGSEHIKSLFDSKIFAYPKSEYLIQRVLEISTQPSDIVLDFHLGSGTTAAVAHKMGRQYIGIEQMDYIETVAVERLKKVLAGEQGGISKAVNWQGGGSFVYLELKKYNQLFIEKIETANSQDQLLTIWEEMKEKSFLNYNIDIKKQEAEMEAFKKLDLQQQKEILCTLLDKNQLYVNVDELNDKHFVCTEEDKKVTKEFYNC